jgi:hypothetical protein
LNGQQVRETHDDVDYAKGLVERLICDELEMIVPAFRMIKARVPRTLTEGLFHPVPFDAVGKRDDDGDNGSTDKSDAQ